MVGRVCEGQTATDGTDSSPGTQLTTFYIPSDLIWKNLDNAVQLISAALPPTPSTSGVAVRLKVSIERRPTTACLGRRGRLTVAPPRLAARHGGIRSRGRKFDGAES